MNVFQQIIDMDKAAAARVAQADESRRRELDESGEYAARFREETLARGKEKLEARRRELDRKLSEKRASAAELQSARVKELDSVFGSNREKWQSEIMKRITGV